MDRLSIVLVIVESNDFQLAQELAAQEAAQRLGVDLQAVKIEEDAIQQSQQLVPAEFPRARTRCRWASSFPAAATA